MACDLTSGILRECKDSLGGVRNVYLINYVDDAFTINATTNEATAINPLVTVAYEYEIDGDNHSLSEEFVSSRAEGTSVNTQTLSIVLKKMTAAKGAELNILVKGRTIAVIRDRNDVYKIVGDYDGIDFNVTAATGAAKTDLNGYTLTGTSVTNKLAPTLDAATTTAFLAIVA